MFSDLSANKLSRGYIMDIWLLILRLAHIGGAVIWVGFGLFGILYLGKIVGATGPAGQQVVGYLISKTTFVRVVSAAAGITTLAGILLFLRDSNNLSDGNWLK